MDPCSLALEIFKSLNSRDYSILLWSFLLLVFGLTKASIRSALNNVVKAVLRWKLLLGLALSLTYVFAVVWLLGKLDLWNLSLTKDTLLWFVLTALILLSRSVTSPYRGTLFFKTSAREQVKAIIFLEFILNTYTFTFWIEIVLVPFLSLLFMVSALAKLNAKEKLVGSFIDGTISFIGFLILFFAVAKLSKDYESLFSLDALRQFLLPVMLTFLFYPFLYFLVLLATYEEVFLRAHLGNRKSVYFRAKIFWKLVKTFHFRIDALEQFRKERSHKLMSVQNAQEVSDLLNSNDRWGKCLKSV